LSWKFKQTKLHCENIVWLKSNLNFCKLCFIQAIGYNYGVATITNTIATSGAPASIAIVPDRSTILDDGQDVSVVTVEVIDAQGRVVPTATNSIHFTVTGGSILGVGNGNPSSHEADKAVQRSVFNGLAEVIVQSATEAGPIKLTATSSGLVPTSSLGSPAPACIHSGPPARGRKPTRWRRASRHRPAEPCVAVRR